MLGVASVLARRSTCAKAAVGCVLCDAHGRILSTGYNGVARGQPHCNAVGYVNPAAQRRVVFLEPYPAHGATQLVHPHRCAGADAPAGADLCEAIHAEANALLWCRDPDAVRTAYVTLSPCMRCAKELLQTGLKQLVYGAPYTQEPQALELLRRAGVELFHFTEDPP